MKKIIIILLFLSSNVAFSQFFSVFDVNTDDFPIVKAKFFAIDAAGNQMPNLMPSDFELTENGHPGTVTYVSCPPPKPPQTISSVLTLDISGSMKGTNMDMAKTAAKAWINAMNLGKSECAVTSFNSSNFLNMDFTTDGQMLLDAIEDLKPGGGTDFDAGLIKEKAGALLIAEKGKHKKVVVFLTDGKSKCDAAAVIQKANQINAVVYCIALNLPCPQSLKDISTQTGGQWFENISSAKEAEDAYMQILMTAQGSDPCSIEWESGISCTAGNTNVKLRFLNFDATAAASYRLPDEAIAKLEIEPRWIKILKPEVGVQKDTTIMITAQNADFTVTDITANNASFFITPSNFTLNDGQSIELTISYIAPDSGYVYSRFDFESEPCITKYYASGGWPGKRPTIRTIKLIHPNGGEVFVAGSDTVITWEGVPPEEPVKLEYRTDDNQPWITIADSATGLSHPFKVPKIASKKYLARVTAAAQTSNYCGNPDVELCGKIWMGCNLDVEHYRNGDPIPQVTDPDEWANLTTGAWCYYNNDPANGELYGKLYNWYAVNDPRGLAPEGWHVPSDEEWKELEICLGMSREAADRRGGRGTNEGSKLAGNYGLWKDGYLRSNSEFGSSGFNARPGGYRHYNNGYSLNIGLHGYWWSSTEHSSTIAISRNLYYLSSNVYRYYYGKRYGFSVRCVRD